MKHIFKIGLATVLIVGGTAAAVWGWIQWRYDRSVVTDIAAAPEMPVAIVFGAGIRADGRLSPMLADRMDTAVALYNAGKVRKLLVSGDNRFVDYDEPGRMYDYAVAHGVPPADVVRDYAGRRTYDTCYRAQGHLRRGAGAPGHAALPSAAGHLHLPQPGGGRHRLFGGSPALLVEQLLPLPRRLRHPARLVGRQDRPPAAGAGAAGGDGSGSWKLETGSW